MNAASRVGALWIARHSSADFLSLALPATLPVCDDSWRELGQSWTGEKPEADFRPGWARVSWNASGLFYETVFIGKHFGNRARVLNEFTWTLGDVCEVFVQAKPDESYLEIHVTPENQRLQLRFPNDAIAAVRAERATLEDFLEADANWTTSKTKVWSDRWYTSLFIPSRSFGCGYARFQRGQRLRTTVCRYDYSARADRPVLSSTAPLKQPSFHDRADWSALELGD